MSAALESVAKAAGVSKSQLVRDAVANHLLNLAARDESGRDGGARPDPRTQVHDGDPDGD